MVWRLGAGDVYARPVTFPEGLTIREMAAVFERGGLGSAGDFEAAAADRAAIAASIDPEAAQRSKAICFRTPTRCRAGRAPTPPFGRWSTRFGQVFDDRLRADAQAIGLTRPSGGDARVADREGNRPGPKSTRSSPPCITTASKRSMRLQCDPTVIYALMKAGRWNGNIRRDDLQIDSPYNTYRYPGLPPGPIAAPGRASLEAAVRPADAPYLYFVSRNDGSHVFATTLEEHNRNVATWQIGTFAEVKARAQGPRQKWSKSDLSDASRPGLSWPGLWSLSSWQRFLESRHAAWLTHGQRDRH